MVVTIHTDGGCHGNPGPGGWAAVLSQGPNRREISGGSPATTNNRMELQGAIEALKVLKVRCDVTFYTDSNYVKNGITTWLHGWKKNGWRTKAKQPVKNADLWRLLDEQAQRHSISWHWLKGHAGHEHNERCDILANEAIAKVKAGHTPAQLKEALAALIAAEASVSNKPAELFG